MLAVANTRVSEYLTGLCVPSMVRPVRWRRPCKPTRCDTGWARSNSSGSSRWRRLSTPRRMGHRRSSRMPNGHSLTASRRDARYATADDDQGGVGGLFEEDVRGLPLHRLAVRRRPAKVGRAPRNAPSGDDAGQPASSPGEAARPRVRGRKVESGHRNPAALRPTAMSRGFGSLRIDRNSDKCRSRCPGAAEARRLLCLEGRRLILPTEIRAKKEHRPLPTTPAPTAPRVEDEVGDAARSSTRAQPLPHRVALAARVGAPVGRRAVAAGERSGSWSPSIEPSSRKRRSCALHRRRRRRARSRRGFSTARWGPVQARPRRNGARLGAARELVGCRRGRGHEHVRAYAGGRADEAGKREQDLHGDADPAARPGRQAPRQRHRRQVAAGAAPSYGNRITIRQLLTMSAA